MTKLTRKPVHNDLISLHIITCSVLDVEKTLGGIKDMAVGIQSFALMFLLVRTKDLVQVVDFLFGCGKFGAEVSDGLFQILYYFSPMRRAAKNQRGKLGTR